MSAQLGDRRWQAGLGALVGVRQAPLGIPDPGALGIAGPATLELVFAAPRSSRRALLLHRGAPFAAAAAHGWALALSEGRVVLLDAAADASIALRSARLSSAAHRVWLWLEADGRPRGGAVDGRPLRRAPVPAWDVVHGELPAATGIVVGGLRDLAGGHTDLRFGERRGEWIERVAWWEGVQAPSPAGPTSAQQAGSRSAPRRVDAVGSAGAPGAVRLTLRRDADGWRYACEPPELGPRVLWDFEDELAVGASVERPAALVPSHPRVVLWLPGGAPRRLRAPRARGTGRPVEVFGPGAGGYAAFRIPAIERAADGALLAFAEGRLESVSDTCATKDLVVRRSDDDGRSWGPLAIAARAPRTPGGERSLMNPSPVVDSVRGSGRVVLVASYLEANEWAIATGQGRGRLLAWTSDDHGRTWSDPIDVAAQLGLPQGVTEAWPEAADWRVQMGTLGHGVQLRRGPHPGRLCFVGHGTFGPASVFDALGFLFWSDDLGASWQVGPAFTRRADGALPHGWNEGTLAELGDGTLLANARQYRAGRPLGCRATVRISWDAAGRPLPGPIRDELVLVDSAVQASMLAPLHSHPDRLLFCNPAHPAARLRLTLRGSDDGGRSWPHARLLVAGRVGYSDMVALKGDAVGVLYEAGHAGTIRFLRVRAGELPGAA